jgi:hypothetical protein
LRPIFGLSPISRGFGAFQVGFHGAEICFLRVLDGSLQREIELFLDAFSFSQTA